MSLIGAAPVVNCPWLLCGGAGNRVEQLGAALEAAGESGVRCPSSVAGGCVCLDGKMPPPGCLCFVFWSESLVSGIAGCTIRKCRRRQGAGALTSRKIFGGPPNRSVSRRKQIQRPNRCGDERCGVAREAWSRLQRLHAAFRRPAVCHPGEQFSSGREHCRPFIKPARHVRAVRERSAPFRPMIKCTKHLYAKHGSCPSGITHLGIQNASDLEYHLEI